MKAEIQEGSTKKSPPKMLTSTNPKRHWTTASNADRNLDYAGTQEDLCRRLYAESLKIQGFHDEICQLHKS